MSLISPFGYFQKVINLKSKLYFPYMESSLSLSPLRSLSYITLNRPRRAVGDEAAGSSSEADFSCLTGPPRLQWICFRNLNPERLPQQNILRGGGEKFPDQCLVKFLNQDITDQEISQLTEECVWSITQSQIPLLTAVFFNRLPLNLVRALTPEQLSGINPNVMKELHITHLLALTPMQIQSLTREQIRNIPIDIIQKFVTGDYDFLKNIPIKKYLWFQYLTLEQLGGLTSEQINSILEAIKTEKQTLWQMQLWNVLVFQIPRLLRMLNREQVQGLTEEALRRLAPFMGEVNVFRDMGGRVSHWFTERQREFLTPEQRAILDANIRDWRIVENWTPAMIAQMGREQILALSPRTFASLSTEQIAAISPQTIVDLGEYFWESLAYKLRYDLTGVEREHIMHSFTKEQVAKMSTNILSLLPLYYLSPEAMSIVPPEVFRNERCIWPSNGARMLTTAQIAAWMPQQVARIPAEWFASFDEAPSYLLNHVLNPEAFRALTGEHFNWLARYEPDGIKVLTKKRLQIIPPSTISQITDPTFFRLLIESDRLRWLTPQQLAVLTGMQVRNLSLVAFTAQLQHLQPAVFSEVTSDQLGELNEAQIFSLTIPQLQAIPVSTLRAMSREQAVQLYRWLTQAQRAGLTPEQHAFFEDLMAGLTTQEAGKRNEDSTPPPGGSSGGNGQGGSSGGPGTGGGGASGGARPKDPNAFRTFIKFANSKTSGNKRSAVPMLPLETIRQKNAAFWEPKYTTFSTPLSSSGDNSTYGFNAAFGFERRVIEADLKKYQECVRELTDDQLRAIPDALIPLIDPLFFGCLSPRQLMRMRSEQRAAITAKFIKVEGDLKRILNITDDRIVTPAEYQAILDKADRKRIRDRLTQETIQTLADDPRSFLLYHLKPEHFFDNGANDWNRDQIAALPKELIVSVWTADYFNRLTPHQWLGIRARYFREIAPEVIAGWKQNCFEPPFVLESNNEYQQGYQDRICTLEKRQIQAISPKVISTLSPKFFEKNFDTLRIKMLTKKQVEAISEKTINNLSPRVFYNLIRSVDGVNLMTPNQIADGRRLWIALTPKQIAAMPLTFFSTFGEYNNSQLSVLDSFNLSQIRAIRTEQLDAMKLDFSKLTAQIYNGLSTIQIQTRNLAQIRALDFSLLADLSKAFINKLTAIQIAGLEPEQIVALKEKIGNIHPDVFRDAKAIANTFSNATGDQLRLLSRAQMSNVDITKISSPVFGKACEKGGVNFLKKFTSEQINSLSLAQRTAIPIKIYGALIIEIYNKMTDAEIEQYAINLPAAAFRMALIAWKEGLEEGEATFHDQHRQEILKGTFRVKIERTAPATPPTITFSSGQRGWRSDWEWSGLETQIRSPQVETRVPSRGVELRA